MDLLNEIGPEFCASVGLDCGSCVQRCAATTAAVCKNLQPYGAERVFFQMYPSTACHHMASAFVEAYRDAAMPSIAIAAKPITRAARVAAAAA